MGALLRVIGGLWAAVGVWNIVEQPWSVAQANSGSLTFAILFNMVLFVLPGLAVLGIGSRMASRSETAPAGNVKDRLAAVDQLHADAAISDAERDRRRAEILRDV